VDTKFGRADLFLHPSEHRGMSPREAARLQGFPDHFEFLGTRQDKFVQIGNAVPPPMASALCEFIREAILKA
jgi:DNA (cytosine-5)-methyltransferase 1